MIPREGELVFVDGAVLEIVTVAHDFEKGLVQLDIDVEESSQEWRQLTEAKGWKTC